MRKILQKDFFERPALRVAEDLLGKYLVKQSGDGEMSARITEVEAYGGFEDKASHAHRGKTPRNAPMFGEAGVWYVYFVYGIHFMLNIVTDQEDIPSAILIRGVEGISGPGKLTKHFAIDKMYNAKKADTQTGLWIEDRGELITPKHIRRLPRVGVAYAGEVWAKKPYRFFLDPDVISKK
ncbi:MAG TPA: DNA-3-methyladenine glycosylase [Candidatus Paceibacterota bacterium]|nr:DNA-3-methyladenine glycosylase [Candidatus Paceibacterota bacterium]